MESFDFLSDYYSSYDEDGRLLSNHGQVEFLTTMKFIKKYLKSGMRVLEIGAGTGRYSLAVAKMGYHVDAVELVQHNIDIFSEKITPDTDITLRKGNALNLSCFTDEQFDIVLLLGPMYHLFSTDEQFGALSEALRVTKKNGLLFTAYCITDASLINYGFIDNNIGRLIEADLVDTENFVARSTPKEVFQLYRKEDIDLLMQNFATERLHYIGTDMATNYMRATVDAMDNKTFELYMKYHFCICERQDMVGATHHSLDIVRKLA